MRKKFVILHDAMTENTQKQFVAWLQEKRIGWWHWVDGSWLAIDTQGSATPALFRDYLTRELKLKRVLVLEVNDNDSIWAGFGPIKEPKNMFAWIRDTWFKKPSAE